MIYSFQIISKNEIVVSLLDVALIYMNNNS